LSAGNIERPVEKFLVQKSLQLIFLLLIQVQKLEKARDRTHNTNKKQ